MLITFLSESEAFFEQTHTKVKFESFVKWEKYSEILKRIHLVLNEVCTFHFKARDQSRIYQDLKIEKKIY